MRKKKSTSPYYIYSGSGDAVQLPVYRVLFYECPEGKQQLFTGLKPIEDSNYEANTYADSVKEEMEFALHQLRRELLWEAAISVLRFQSALWIWNAFSPIG